ncbi:MAG: undecaprenyl-diphosphate phosphatase [Candidatus Omnitrophica bacterium]|nr:undecaprenyl-diphosphate phosphatase [Candidatus Omnitrophota bacterium]
MFKIIILALVQGIAEFLPISSSGHLSLVNHFFPSTPENFFLAVFLHGGTLLATIIYFRSDIARLFAGFRFRSEKGPESRRYLAAIIAGSIPVGILGLFLEEQAERIFVSPPLLAVMFLITGLALAIASLPRCRSSLPLPEGCKSASGGERLGEGEKGKGSLNFSRAFGIGCAQLAAVLPGISRSGSTISAGLISGLSRQEAFRFSFLLSLPAVAGAFLIEGVKGLKAGISIPVPEMALGFTLSFGAGFLALHLLRRLVLAGRLVWFSIYLLILGLFTAFL